MSKKQKRRYTNMKHTLYHNLRKIVIFIMHDKKVKQPEHSLQKDSSCGISSVKMAHALLFWEYSSRRSGSAGSSRGCNLFLVKSSIYFSVIKPPFHQSIRQSSLKMRENISNETYPKSRNSKSCDLLIYLLQGKTTGKIFAK